MSGIAAWLYYAILFWALNFLWHTLPEEYLVVGHWSPDLYWLWIPLVGVVMALGVGVTVKLMGGTYCRRSTFWLARVEPFTCFSRTTFLFEYTDPGDLPYTIKCVHEKAYVAMDHVMPMVCASQFSILGGGSLGPEAPLVAICAALGGFISRHIFGVQERNLVRKHTLMGMAGALAAFFGCPLGGSLFALEVNSRFGVEYFEHLLEAIFSGEICVCVFRALAGLPIESIWKLTEKKLPDSNPVEILYGFMLGLMGAAVAALFAFFHAHVMEWFTSHDLIRNERAIPRALLGSVVVIGLGILIPHTMFWGEFEIQTVGTLSTFDTLPHIWPTSGLLGFEAQSFSTSLLVGLAKLVAISFTVAGGYRGGYIFPLFCSGAALGRSIHFLMPFIPVQLCVLCMAASMNVALTRTPMATTLILSYLSGEQSVISAVLAASLISLFVTAYMPFIKTQVDRADISYAVAPRADYSATEDEEGSQILEVEEGHS